MTAAAPPLFLLVALLSQHLGAAWAKTLFPLVGADGAAAMRVGLAALMLSAAWRPWRKLPDRETLRFLVLYGAMLGMMNPSIYRAMELIPIGVAVAIEAAGPLAVALFGCRRPVDPCWIALAALGLGLLSPLDAVGSGLDPTGLAWAGVAALCWALYIVFGKRISALPAGQATGGVFGLIVGGSPAIAAPDRLPAAGEGLIWTEWTAVVRASIGSATSAARAA